jgi:predicted ATPase
VILRELDVENFRPFGQAGMRLPDHGLVLVAGANNTGKSALLSGLDIVADVNMGGQGLRRAGSPAPAKVAATFTLTTEERLALFAQNPRGANLVGSGAARRLQFVFGEQPEGKFLITDVLSDWGGSTFQPLATVGPRERGGAYVTKMIGGLLSGQDDYPPQLLMELPDRAWGDRIPLETSVKSLDVPALKLMMEMRSAWGSRYYHFRALRPGTERSAVLMSAPRLMPTGENLGAVILDLLTNRPEILGELRRLIAEIVPGIGELGVHTSGGNMEIVFTANGIGLNLKDLGTGVEQLLMTLVIGLTGIPPFVLVIEEPETNLHHAAQRAMLGLLKDWAADRQIIAATHSPVLLDWSPGGDRLWHVTRTRGVSTVEPVGDDPSALLSALGVRLSDVLSATRVLVLEGPSDEDVLGAWFPEILRSPDIAILRGRGGDNARHADQLAEWLTSVDKIGLRRVLYLRDRDELSASALDKLEHSNTVKVLQRRELENYLLDPAAVTQVLGQVIPKGKPLPSVQEVTAAMTEAAKDLRGKIVINRVCRQVQPPRRLMEHSLRQSLANQGADQEAVTAAIAERLMTGDELRAQVRDTWMTATADVTARSGDELLAIAPGDEILTAVFLQFAGRGYNKRNDGVAIAKAMTGPPREIQQLLNGFTRDEPECFDA